jgi:hypothetical protein
MTREELKTEIDWEEKWLARAGYNAYNVGIAFDSIKHKVNTLEQKPCKDAVSRQAILEWIKESVELYANTYSIDMLNMWMLFEEQIKAMPPVTPTRKKGKWIIDDEELGRIWYCHCSNCKKDPQDYIGGTENWWLVRLPDYCPNCGIKMESEEE